MSTDDPAPAADDRLAELRFSARGWLRVQLASLGFIGLCGVIKSGESPAPEGLQALSGMLVLVAFAAACLGIYSVGKAAWPIYGPGPVYTSDDPGALQRASSQLKRGLVLTFVSIALTALATTTSWWPTDDGGGDGGGGDAGASVQIQATSGQSICGELAESTEAGTLRLVADGQPVTLQLGQVASVRPVGGC